MPGVQSPLDGFAAYVSKLQGLATRITALETWIRQGSPMLRSNIAHGVATVNFPSSASATTLVVAHELPAAPTIAPVWLQGLTGTGTLIEVVSFNLGATTFEITAQAAASLNQNIKVGWLAAVL